MGGRAAARRAEEHLATKAAQIEVENIRNEDDRLDFDVTVRNLAGHKLPTAYPSRRVWLHVVVRDENDGIVFESGRPNMDVSIDGNDNDRDGGLFEPHYLQITDPGQVQIYESIMADLRGEVTTGLVFGTRYLKDSRVPPLGFAKETAPHEVAVIGNALEDPDFVGGSDTTHFSIPLSDSEVGNVSVELLYQSIGYRWAKNLEEYDSFESRRFTRYFDENASESTKFLACATADIN